MNQKLKIALLIAAIASLLVGAVMAATYISGAWEVTVQTVTVTIAGTSHTITLGDSVTLTATMTPHVTGKTVTFLDGTTALGTDVTDASGIATFVTTPTAAGIHNYYAKVDYP